MSVKSVPVHNRDYITVMPEEEIRSKVSQYRGWIESGRRRGVDTFEVEIEYCYLAEELQLREARHRAHDDYMRRQPRSFEGNGYDYGYDNDQN